MKNAIILHGGPSKREYYDPAMPSMSNTHWIPWLQSQLLKKDFAAYTPEVPHSYDRVWSVWKKEVERYEINENTTLVGHSTGAGFFIKYLSINPHIKVDKVLLVAPWLDPDCEHTKNFFDDFEIEKNMAKRTNGVTVFYSTDDQKSVLKTVNILKDKTIGLNFLEFSGYRHFTIEDMKTPVFPELLEEIVK